MKVLWLSILDMQIPTGLDRDFVYLNGCSNDPFRQFFVV